MIRRALLLSSSDEIHEIGVFPAPPVDLAGPYIAVGHLPEGEEIALSDEWLAERDLETHVSDEPLLAAMLPRGRVRRLDVDPRIVIFEDIPHAEAVRGPIYRTRNGKWILDSRTEPAILILLSSAVHDLVIWGESGQVRVFAVRRNHRGR